MSAVAGLSLVVAGCSSDSESTGNVDKSASSPDGATMPGEAGLKKYYDQRLKFEDCDGVQCAWLTVPVDYAKPDGPTIKIAVSKYAASGKSKGQIVYNPGGPGASGYEYAQFALDPTLAKDYDAIGFDPRGVGKSAPITCVDDAGMDDFLGADPTPTTEAEKKAAVASAKKFADSCKKKAGPLLGHVSTVEVAKDLDVLRSALGQKKLNYLGMSYGTFIGSTYAGLFPKKVGRFVLDGVVPPDVDSDQMNLGQAEGFEAATRSYVQDCIDQGNCYLGDTVDAGMKKIQDFMKGLSKKPMPIEGQGGVTEFTEGWAVQGLALGFYSKQLWPELTEALRSAMNGDPNKLMAMSNQYADRTANGSYTTNAMQSFYAVSCLDRKGYADTDKLTKTTAEFTKKAPTWGPMLAWGSLVCGVWGEEATGKAEKIDAKGSDPILVIGTTRDPATPYRFSEQLAGDLDNARLLTLDGDGHTAYGGNECINAEVRSYFTSGKLPAEGKRCS